MKRVVAVNERGLRIGEDHRLAKLTNAEVDLLLALREEGCSYRFLARKFEISKSAVRWYVIGGRRCQTPTDYKEVHVPD
jgi:DNA-directed RNA polymerase specialized sigma24 family protein